MVDAFALFAEPVVVAAEERVIVVDKPPRMHCAPGRSADSLCSWVFARFPDAAGAGRGSGRSEAEGGLLHRLDFETSGLVLFARDPEALAFLLREQREGRFRKEYLLRAAPAACCRPEGSRPRRAAPTGVDEGSWAGAIAALDTRRLAELLGGGSGGQARIVSAFRPYGPGAARVACLACEETPREAAETAARPYVTEIVSALPVGDALEIGAALELGFRHQLRAQLAWIGLPILGDPLYGGRSAARLFLCARRLCFRHPGTGREAMIEID